MLNYLRPSRFRLPVFGLLTLTLSLRAAQPAAPPPADAAQKAAEARRIDELYQQKKATLSAERQAWETLLEQHLGEAFYLPRHKRDFVAGVSTAWDFVVDDPKLPRVLLIGDSISRAYTLGARRNLAGKANVHRAPENCGPTANGLAKLDVWLGPGNWDVIYVNFGIHDRATPIADYEARLTKILARLQRTGARIIWASSTPLPAQSTYGSDEAIMALNRAAAGIAAGRGIMVDDLYAHITPHLGMTQKPNDVHFTDRGYELLAERVSATIERELTSSPERRSPSVER